ncbi:hypothetical protein ACWEPO_01180 [Streptomyces albidoflavus]
MDVFVCAGCEAVLSAPVARVALPVHARQRWGHSLMPVLMGSGTYAVDPEPGGPAGVAVLAPGDLRGTVLLPERCDGCCGSAGGDGPNLACVRCGLPVATRVDDCGYWQEVWCDPGATRIVPGTDVEVPSRWAELAEEYAPLPPVAPEGWWDPRWAAAVGAALAGVVALSGGRPVAVAPGPLAVTLGRAVDALLPPGPPGRTVVPAGPGLPVPEDPRALALVPVHPRTGEVWPCPGGVDGVPLDAAVWLHVARGPDELPHPAAGRVPAGVHRDEPLPLRPLTLFRADLDVFLRTLSRLPAFHEPWLRRIHEEVRGRGYAWAPF